MKNKRGFTLIELLSVILLLAVIIVIAVPKVADYTTSKKKDSFLIMARGIMRQLEYDYIEDKPFYEKTLEELELENIPVDSIDLTRSFVYKNYGEFYIELVGKGDYEGLYICSLNYADKDVEVQNSPCEWEE